jgi:hypothetical protein
VDQLQKQWTSWRRKRKDPGGAKELNADKQNEIEKKNKLNREIDITQSEIDTLNQLIEKTPPRSPRKRKKSPRPKKGDEQYGI